jgi:hypothetical protein
VRRQKRHRSRIRIRCRILTHCSPCVLSVLPPEQSAGPNGVHVVQHLCVFWPLGLRNCNLGFMDTALSGSVGIEWVGCRGGRWFVLAMAPTATCLFSVLCVARRGPKPRVGGKQMVLASRAAGLNLASEKKIQTNGSSAWAAHFYLEGSVALRCGNFQHRRRYRRRWIT